MDKKGDPNIVQEILGEQMKSKSGSLSNMKVLGENEISGDQSPPIKVVPVVDLRYNFSCKSAHYSVHHLLQREVKKKEKQ